MADVIPNLELIALGILRQAKVQPDPVSWLTEKHSAALEEVMGGAVFITSTGSPEGSHSAVERLPADTRLQIYEACLRALETEGLAAEGTLPPPGHIRHADFSSHPCILG